MPLPRIKKAAVNNTKVNDTIFLRARVKKGRAVIRWCLKRSISFVRSWRRKTERGACICLLKSLNSWGVRTCAGIEACHDVSQSDECQTSRSWEVSFCCDVVTACGEPCEV